MATICATFYFISVLVRDGGVPSLSSTTTILCTVEDENDHAPDITVSGHNVEVLENQEPGVLYTVLASDMDAGNNGAVRYHIIGKYLLRKNSPQNIPQGAPRWLFSMWCVLQCLKNTHSVRAVWCHVCPFHRHPEPLAFKFLNLPSTTLVNFSRVTLLDVQMEHITFFSIFVSFI